jgi:hypothetical protein
MPFWEAIRFSKGNGNTGEQTVPNRQQHRDSGLRNPGLLIVPVLSVDQLFCSGGAGCG